MRSIIASITLGLTIKEYETIKEMARKKDLSEEMVLLQALRLYDAIDKGAYELKSTRPIGGCMGDD